MEHREGSGDCRVKTVIINSTPLIYLAAIGRFEVLQTLYGRILIPTALHEEVVAQGAGASVRMSHDAGRILFFNKHRAIQFLPAAHPPAAN